MTVTDAILLVTLAVLGLYTWYTKRLAEQQAQATTFDALTRIHNRMAEGRSQRRRLLHYFPGRF